jgi:hypothetical protein
MLACSPCSPQAVAVPRAALKVAFHRPPSVAATVVTPGAAAAFVAQLSSPRGVAEEGLAAIATAFLDAAPPAAGGDADGARAARELAAALRAAGYAAAAVEDGGGGGARGACGGATCAAGAAAAPPPPPRPGSPSAAVHASLLQRAARHVFVAVDPAGARTRAPTRPRTHAHRTLKKGSNLRGTYVNTTCDVTAH